MAKKNFIRHLEYYGFLDQNTYNGMPNIDLSGIYETNREQDKEISEISGETSQKASIAMVNELSGTVTSFIDRQGEINEAFLENISGLTEDIETLKERDEEFTDKINELTDSINDLSEEVEEGTQVISEMSGKVESVSELVEGFEEVISGMLETVDTLEEDVAKKLDSDVAEETYAKKSEVYSREEADETFLKEHQDLDWVRDDIDVLSGAIDTIQQEIEDLPIFDDKKYVKKEDFNEYSANTQEEISELAEIVASDSATVASLSATVETLSSELDGKVDMSVFNDYTNEIEDRLEEFDAKKADVTALTQINSAIASVSGALESEVSERQQADQAVNDRLDEINDEIGGLDELIEIISGGSSSLASRLDQEIEDRKAADLAIIGTSADTSSASSVWGAKKYAVIQKDIAVAQANEYTDNVFGTIESEIATKFDEVDTEIRKKADKTYVDETVDEKVGDAYDELNSKIENENARAVASEINLQNQINEIVESGSCYPEFDKVYRRLNVITTYTGDTPDEYENTGNGVLDVLHREFHELEDEIGIITNPTLERTNQYESAFGTYNKSNTGTEPSQQTIFSIGIGTSETDRRNAVEVRKDGNLYLWVEGEYMCVNDLLSMLAHETYN